MTRGEIIGLRPVWDSAFAANWSRERGRAFPRAGRVDSEWLAAVEAQGRVAATMGGRPVPSPDDLRHAAAWVASADLHVSHGYRPGARWSWKALDDRQGDHLRTLCGLLADPVCLAEVNLWLHPEERTRARWVARIRGMAVAEARLRGIASGAFGRGDWEGLPVAELQRFGRILATVRR